MSRSLLGGPGYLVPLASVPTHGAALVDSARRLARIEGIDPEAMAGLVTKVCRFAACEAERRLIGNVTANDR